MLDRVEALIRFVDGWQDRQVVVVGDFMLDRYVYGNADRLSPDAPVPVLASQREEWRPGGAGGVSLNLRSLRCQVACVGVVGRDVAAKTLRTALGDQGCDVSGLIESLGRPTTVKHNFVGLAQHRHPQKMFRVDEESRQPVSDKISKQLLAVTRRSLRHATALCLEDYNKGVLAAGLCGQLIDLAHRKGVPVFVDPAAIDDYTKYRSASCITPNRTEATLASVKLIQPKNTDTGRGSRDSKSSQARVSRVDVAGDLPPEVTQMAQALQRKHKIEAVVLTLDKQGALLAQRGNTPQHVPTEARAVYDVTGAGDTVLAMLAAARANGADWLTAVQLANVAAGLEVEKFGAVPIELDEVLLSLLMQHRQTLGKVRTLDQLLPELAAFRKQGKRVALTNGCFDILHAGHVALLRGARQTADLLVLAVNSDASIRRLKGPQRPIVPLDDRLEVLRELECVDYIIVFGDERSRTNRDTPKALLRAIQPDVLVKGGTYKLSEVVGGSIVESYGGQVVTIAPVQGRSTTNIVDRIKAQAASSRS